MAKLKPKHINDSVGTTRKTMLENKDVYWIQFYNTHASNRLDVSFDGTQYRRVTAGNTWEVRGFSDKPVQIDKLWLKADAVSTTFEIVYLEAK